MDASIPCLIRPGHEPAAFAAMATLVTAENQDTPLRTATGEPLPCGAVVELGYFDEATIHRLFAGRWVPLIGLDAPRANRSISPIFAGNHGESPGMFSWCRTFFTGIDALAPVGRPLALRVYDHPNSADALFYNTVSHAAWWFREPRSPSPAFVFMSLTESNLRWESGPAGAFRTVLRHTRPRHVSNSGWRRALHALGDAVRVF